MNNWFTKLSQSNIFYHGANCSIDRFSIDFLGSGRGNNMEGPGIYFTTDITDAKQYGQCLHKVQLIPTGKVISDQKPASSFSRKDLISIIKRGESNSPTHLIESYPEDFERLGVNLSNYHQNPQKALILAVKGIYSHNNSQKDVAQSIWSQFYSGQQKLFVEQMVSHGYDMTLIEFGHKTHAIVYNSKIIKYLGKQES